MICLNCKRQIPDNAPNCPNCGAPVVPAVQVGHEIKFRRRQRWFFYAVISIMFLAMVGFCVYIYNQNAMLLNASVELQSSLTKTQNDLAGKDELLKSSAAKVSQLEQDLSAKTTQLIQKTGDLDTSVAAREQAVRELEQFKTQLAAINPNIFSVAVNMSVALSAADLAKIPVAEANLGVGPDSDADGLSDAAEAALGTDSNKADTDGDGFSDRKEIIGGYNPLSKTGKLPLDAKFAAGYKGKFVRATAGDALWFVSSRDGKRYFLGAPATALKAFEPIPSNPAKPASAAPSATSTPALNTASSAPIPAASTTTAK